MGQHVHAGDAEVWTEQRGTGPDVLLIGGLGDTIESWQFQLDGLAERYRLTAFDNRGAGRTTAPDERLTVESMAEAAAAVLRGLEIPSAHVAGFSSGSVIAQELTLRHPELVRSLVLQSTWAAMDPYLRSVAEFIRWTMGAVPDERTLLRYFFLFIYTARAHNSGTVDAVIEEALAFPHRPTVPGLLAHLDAVLDHDTRERLPRIAVPALVLAGGRDITARPELGRAVADLIPGARFQVLEEEAHQPFQEVPEQWNGLVDAFWQEVEAQDGAGRS